MKLRQSQPRPPLVQRQLLMLLPHPLVQRQLLMLRLHPLGRLLLLMLRLPRLAMLLRLLPLLMLLRLPQEMLRRLSDCGQDSGEESWGVCVSCRSVCFCSADAVRRIRQSLLPASNLFRRRRCRVR